MDLEALQNRALDAIAQAEDEAALQSLRVHYLGRKSELTTALRGLGKLPKEERAAVTTPQLIGKVMKSMVPPMILIFGVLGSIFTGVATPAHRGAPQQHTKTHRIAVGERQLDVPGLVTDAERRFDHRAHFAMTA